MKTNRPANNSGGIGPHLSDETLSELASGRLSDAAREATLRHLATCAECAATARDDAVIRSLLRQLPAPRPNRSFQLTEEQVNAAARRPRWPSLASSLPALRAATITVALLLLAVAGTDWLTRPAGNNASEHFAAMVAPTEAITTHVTSGGDGAAEAPATEAPAAKSANRAPTETAAANPAAAAAPNETTANEAEAPGSAADSDAAGMAGAAAPASAAKVSPNLEASPTAPPTATAVPSPTPTVTPTATPSPTATPAAMAASASKPDRTGWRVAELALGLLLLWMIVTYVGAWQTSRNRG